MTNPPYQIRCKEFSDGPIDGVIVTALQQHEDERGWLVELFRKDEIGSKSIPVMGYVSQTKPGVTRGPHMHYSQTDHFVAMGPGVVEFCMWDDRADQPTFGNRMTLTTGSTTPLRISIPPMIVHAYRNISDEPCRLMNFPDQLYAGDGRKSPVDEVRFEDISDHPFCW